MPRLNPLRGLAPNASTRRFVTQLARQPLTTARRLGGLTAELVQVGIGTSTVAPAKRDRRFTDPAWTRNPLLRAIASTPNWALSPMLSTTGS
jgi:polyhydroxyalkanoate synthase